MITRNKSLNEWRELVPEIKSVSMAKRVRNEVDSAQERDPHNYKNEGLKLQFSPDEIDILEEAEDALESKGNTSP